MVKSAIDREFAVQKNLEGWSQTEIGQHFGRTRAAVSAMFKTWGVRWVPVAPRGGRHKEPDQKQLQRLRVLARDGTTKGSAATEMGICGPTLKRWITRHEIVWTRSSPYDDALIVTMMDQRDTLQTIADHFGVSVPSLWRHMQRVGIVWKWKGRKRASIVWDDDLIVRLMNEGWLQSTIARQLGRNKQALCQHLKDVGIKWRKVS